MPLTKHSVSTLHNHKAYLYAGALLHLEQRQACALATRAHSGAMESL